MRYGSSALPVANNTRGQEAPQFFRYQHVRPKHDTSPPVLGRYLLFLERSSMGHAIHDAWVSGDSRGIVHHHCGAC